MKTNFRFFSWLCSAVIALLGFAGCSDDPSSMADEYGVPNADYKYMGTITDEEGNPIQGIKAVIIDGKVNTPGRELIAYTTDKDGKFESDFINISTSSDIRIDFKDIDGELNGGEFATTSVEAKDMETTKVGESKGSWNKGSFISRADAKLYPQERDKEQVE